MWKKIKDNSFMLLGSMSILAAAVILLYFNPGLLPQLIGITLVVDQEGFAPVFIPVADASAPENEKPTAISGNIPERIVIAEIGLDAPVVIADSVKVSVDNLDAVQFLVPEQFAAGWHQDSAPLGEIGNTVISGHHNAYGKVFENLVDLENGDKMVLISGDLEFTYKIASKFILPEKDQPLDIRLKNGRWIMPSDDERITLITCWPKNSNSHRLILIGIPSPLEKE